MNNLEIFIYLVRIQFTILLFGLIGNIIGLFILKRKHLKKIGPKKFMYTMYIYVYYVYFAFL